MVLFWAILVASVIASILLTINLKVYWRLRRAKRAREKVFERYCAAAGLTAREIQIVRLVLSGLTYKETADKLCISDKTVESHMGSVYSKTGVKGQLNLYRKLYGQP